MALLDVLYALSHLTFTVNVVNLEASSISICLVENSEVLRN